MDTEEEKPSSRVTVTRLMDDHARIVDSMDNSINPDAVIKAMSKWEERAKSLSAEDQDRLREVTGGLGEKIFERYRREHSPEKS